MRKKVVFHLMTIVVKLPLVVPAGSISKNTRELSKKKATLKSFVKLSKCPCHRTGKFEGNKRGWSLILLF